MHVHGHTVIAPDIYIYIRLYSGILLSIRYICTKCCCCCCCCQCYWVLLLQTIYVKFQLLNIFFCLLSIAGLTATCQFLFSCRSFVLIMFGRSNTQNTQHTTTTTTTTKANRTVEKKNLFEFQTKKWSFCSLCAQNRVLLLL